jgi:O-6-methylguanine DNA methyltransferase
MKEPLIEASFQAHQEELQHVHLRKASHFKLKIEGASPLLSRSIEQWIDAYLAKQPFSFSLFAKTKIEASSFDRKVWDALLSLPFGELLSYQQLAEKIDCPRGARAVGNACGKNRWPLLIACHRIIPSQPRHKKTKIRPGGFAFDPEVKSRLIEFELS